MDSARKAIRQSAVDLLKAGVTTVDDRVYKSRSSSIWGDSELPCVCVYTPDETPERVNDFPKILNRRLTLNIDIFVEDKIDENMVSQTDDLLDDIAQTVEEIMDEHQTLKGNAQSNMLSSFKTTLLEEGKRPVGIARMAFTIEYRTTNQNVGY